MLVCFFLILVLTENTQSRVVELDTAGRALTDIRQKASSIAGDGTILIATKSHIYHFDTDGHLINRFGGPGQGPNEYESIQAAIWTGSHYLISDGRNLRTGIVNGNGEFLAWEKTYYSKFMESSGEYFYVFGGPVKQIRREKPPFVGQFTLVSDGINDSFPRFHELTDKIVSLMYSYHDHFVAVEHQQVFVMNQLEPIIAIYQLRNKAIRGQQSVKLPQFIPGPEEWPFGAYNGNFEMRRKIIEWKHSWSRIEGLHVYQGRYYIAYTVPAENDPNTDTLHRVFRWDPANESGELLDLGVNQFFGYRDGHVYSFHGDDEWQDEVPTYQVHVHTWD